MTLVKTEKSTNIEYFTFNARTYVLAEYGHVNNHDPEHESRVADCNEKRYHGSPKNDQTNNYQSKGRKQVKSSTSDSRVNHRQHPFI